MTEKWYQSKTVWAGAAQILTGVSGYLTGQMDINGAGALIITGAYQIIQRLAAIQKTNAAPCPCDVGGPGGTPGVTGSGQ
jgi:hypothetical protein